MTTRKNVLNFKTFITMMAAVQDEWSFRMTLIRHGETNQNRNKIIQGQENTHLNDTGKEQVELVGNRFKYEHLTRIYSSDLQRAVKTAEGICLRNKHLEQIKICIEPLLRERNYGEAEGKSRSELKKILHSGTLPKGAESESQVQKRAVDFFRKLLRDVNQLRKTHHSNDGPNEDNDLPSEGQHLKIPHTSKVDSVLSNDGDKSDETHLSKSAPIVDKVIRPDVKLRAKSFPLSGETNIPIISNAPVLLKDLCFDVDESTVCSHSERPLHVVIVSHGGIIRHIVSYISKQFSSHFPVDKRKLLRQICPNTGVSDFAVFLKGREVSYINCVQLYDKSHLI